MQTTLPMSLEQGSLIAGRYRVLGALGTGGMGTVVRVQDCALENEIIALKLLNPHLVKDKSIFKRFQREVLLTRQLSHPNIVKVFDMGIAAKGQHFISMELVNGTSLRERLKQSPEKRLPLAEVLRILHEVCEGMMHAHTKGIIHRDLKPDNILISDTGQVKIVDFGFAQTLWHGNELTPAGEAVGTPYYMAPEQIRGDVLDHRCDIYAIGIIAFELAAGRRPFEDKSWFNLAHKHLMEPLPEFASEQIGIPVWFQSIVRSCTAKEREERFQSVEEIAHRLMRPEGELVHNHASGPTILPEFAHLDHGTRYKTVRVVSRVVRKHSKVALYSASALAIFLALYSEMRSNQIVHSEVSGLIQRINDGREHAAAAAQKSGNGGDLIAAVSSGDVQRAEQLLERGQDVGVRDSRGSSLLHLAIDSGRQQMLTLLLDHGADTQMTDRDGATPLMIALKNGNAAAVARLMEADRDINIADAQGRTALFYAIAAKNVGAVRGMINRGASVNVSDSDGTPLLVFAASIGDVDIVQSLLAAGAQASARDRRGVSALDVAISSGQQQLQSVLRGRN